jgi:hypothetical protein
MPKNQNRHAQVWTERSRACGDCGEDIPLTETAFYWDVSDDEVFWTGCPPRFGPICELCWEKRDNYEPPDPDGEAFRGGEAAAFTADQQARLQRDAK